MNKALFIILALAFVGWYLSGPSSIPQKKLTQYSSKQRSNQSYPTVTTGGKCSAEKCLTVYVAPWCPACKTAHKTIVSLTKELKKEGVKVHIIVGSDSKKEVIEYAKSFPFPVLLDPSGEYFKELGVRGVPNFIVSDSSGKITKELPGGYSDVGEMRRQLDI